MHAAPSPSSHRGVSPLLTRALRLCFSLTLLVIASPVTALGQSSNPDSIVVIERGEPGVNGWDVLEFPFQVLTAPLYLMWLGGEWAAAAASDTRVPQKIAFYNRQLNRLGIYPAFASLGAGSGTGAAVRLGPPSSEGKLWGHLAAGATVKLYWQLTARVGYGVEAAEPGRGMALGVQASGSLQHRDRDEFWGIGPDSDEDDRSNYALDRTIVTGELMLGMVRYVALRAHIDWSEAESGAGNNPRLPSVDSIFPANEILRFGDSDRYLSFGASAEWRNGYSQAFVPGGSWVRLAARWNDGRGAGLADFSELMASAGLHLRFDHDRRCLSFVGALQTTRQQGDGEIPFYRLPALGGTSTLPAYPTARFRDRDTALAKIEYLYRIWLAPTNESALIASFFVVGGQVAHDISDELSLSRIRENYGVALSAYAGPTTGARLELAGGDEGLRVNFVFLVGS